ncbi:sensor histidine kinase [Paenibacillus xerothermodurans]|uniref:histidine kinase n=1 Tax=Paenibacillus xerothermodurans TaxID=1977292 RepID=A0A2W1NC44_PAEXE|nr:HAMP domain-containing sensor histidine kinase [Paenibacillus xerothermodurans]PZE22037.1 sensor histidine kinase [Paenibacillus xerothermodurans]
MDSEITYKLILNLFFILFPLFLYQMFWLDRYQRNIQSPWFICALAATSLLLCMSFPYISSQGYFFDLRHVPFIIGMLYGGLRVGLVLLVTLLGYRALIGGDGLLLSIMMGLMSYVSIMMLRARYRTWNAKQRVSYGTLLAIMYSILVLGSLTVTNSSVSADLSVFALQYISIHAVSVWLTIYFVEMMRRNFKMREQIVQSEKLKVISELAASVSHEVRNPLTVTKGFIQLLRGIDLTEEKKTQFIELSLAELERAQKIITDYLSLAKDHEGEIEKLNIADELNYIVSVMAPYALFQQVEMQVHIQEPHFVNADRQRLRQCFINLSKNCIEAMPAGGLLTIHSQRQGDQLVICMKDTGIGMTQAEISQLGTPFFTTKREKGTGLGMMLIFNVIKELRGQVRVDSEKHRGTTFTITIPGIERESAN